MILLSIMMAVSIPLVGLYLLHTLDIYRTATRRGLLLFFGWGCIAFGGAYSINTTILNMQWVSYGLLVLLVAPFIEEQCKAQGFAIAMRHPSVTALPITSVVEFVLYSFCSGIGFAICENLLYLSRISIDDKLSLALARSFSTSFMHGCSTAIIGICLARVRFTSGKLQQALTLVISAPLAVARHSIFNQIISADLGILGVVLATVVGVVGLGLTALLILWGVRIQQRWLREMFGQADLISPAEATLVQKIYDLEAVLEPVTRQWGAHKRAQVMRLLRLEARLGLQRKLLSLTKATTMRTILIKQSMCTQQMVEHQQQVVGAECMRLLHALTYPP